MRAGLARVTNTDYAPWPTAYDGLFPNGTLLTKPTRPAQPADERTTPATSTEKKPE